MAELRPYPMAALTERMFAELAHQGSIFELPRRAFFTGSERDLSVRFHGRRAASALGPAAGPHTQMTQNIVLSWLSGCRILELKTVQILDELDIPRPCIDMQTVGYNVEWSQELTLEQSLDEYVKAAMLIRMLQEHDDIGVQPGYRDTHFDMSVGYDLAGIKSERVQGFVDRMLDASSEIDRLRAQIPDAHAGLRDLDFAPRIADTVTLSTFHGCPPDEIERIARFLMQEKRIHCIVKLNPTLLGPERVTDLLSDLLGYSALHVPASAFEADAKWQQVVDFVGRLGELARSLDLGFGVKFTNTLIVDNHRDFFPKSESSMYLSGPPLHVLAMELVRDFRRVFGDQFPISFSAGIDRKNFPDAVAMGLVPVTVCSDLLKPGGYTRTHKYLGELERRMAAVGAEDIDEYVLRAYPGVGRAALERLSLADDDPARARCERALEQPEQSLAQAAGAHFEPWLAHARVLATEHYVDGLARDSRYHQAKNAKAPRVLDTKLQFFDCVACDKCVYVCPNAANFWFSAPTLDIPKVTLSVRDGQWHATKDGHVRLQQSKQYATFADFCNECGNCDIFCPEQGGPYLVKPLFFGSLADWREFARADGFHIAGADLSTVYARIDGREFEWRTNAAPGAAPKATIGATIGATIDFVGPDFHVTVSAHEPHVVHSGTADSGDIDFTYFHIIKWIRDALTSQPGIDFVSMLARTRH